MSNSFTNFLGQVFDSPYQLKDYAHASRLYVEDYFRLTPKVGFMYYVIFNINPAVMLNNPIVLEFVSKNGPEVGLLVSVADLPKFKIATETINQYNRNTVVQSKLSYQPINITLHDDNNNTTTSLWKAYYNYYFADGLNTKGADTPLSFENTKYNKPGASISESTTYGLNNGQDAPFFLSIELFQLSRKQFTGFRIVNPLISDWAHDVLDQSAQNLMKNKMTINYETVIYSTGKVRVDSPAGFATIHYDSTPSPLSIFGSGNNSLLGPGGVIPGIGELFGDAGNFSIAGLVKTARGGTNLFNNIKNVIKSGLQNEGQQLLDNIARTGKLPFIPTGTTPVNLSLATLPGEARTAAQPAKINSLGQGVNNLIGGINTGIRNINESITGILNRPLFATRTSSELTAVKQDQMFQAEQVSSQLETFNTIQREIEPQLQVARAANDVEQIEAIYSKLDAAGYTDPAKLEENLVTINQNIQALDELIVQAQVAEIPTPPVNIDNTELGISPDDIYNVVSNPDLNTQPANVYTDSTGATTQYYG
jgi:hypothetical protein